MMKQTSKKQHSAKRKIFTTDSCVLEKAVEKFLAAQKQEFLDELVARRELQIEMRENDFERIRIQGAGYDANGVMLSGLKEVLKLSGMRYNYFRDKYGVYGKLFAPYIKAAARQFDSSRKLKRLQSKTYRKDSDLTATVMTREMLEHILELEAHRRQIDSEVAKEIRANACPECSAVRFVPDVHGQLACVKCGCVFRPKTFLLKAALKRVSTKNMKTVAKAKIYARKSYRAKKAHAGDEKKTKQAIHDARDLEELAVGYIA